MSKIVIIGAGNVGFHLALQLKAKGHSILQVFSRSLIRAEEIASRCKAQAIDNISNINLDADIYLMAIKDDRVEELSLHLKLNGKVAAHTSGALPTAILKNVTENYGVFYPFQTFSRTRPLDLSEVPICIDGANEKAKTSLADLGRTLSKKVLEIDEKKRLALHISGVFANNFPNYLFGIAEQILRNEGLKFELLGPLIAETAQKAIDLGPEEAQTGPAKRGDDKILKRHMEFLSHQGNLQKIYELLSRSIEKGNN